MRPERRRPRQPAALLDPDLELDAKTWRALASIAYSRGFATIERYGDGKVIIISWREGRRDSSLRCDFDDPENRTRDIELLARRLELDLGGERSGTMAQARALDAVINAGERALNGWPVAGQLALRRPYWLTRLLLRCIARRGVEQSGSSSGS